MNFKNLINWLSLFADLSDRVDVHIAIGGRCSSVHTFHIDDFFSDPSGSAFLKEYSSRMVKTFCFISAENNPYKVYL